MKALFCLLLVASLVLGNAQSLPDWKYVDSDELALADANALSEVLTQWIPFVKKHSPESADWLYLTDDEQRGYLISFVEDYAQAQRNDETFQKAVAKYMELGLPDLMPLWTQSHRSSTHQLGQFRPDLSYANGEVNLLDLKFRKVLGVYLQLDQVQAWSEGLVRLNELDRAMDIKTTRFVFELKFGTDLPLFWVVIPAESPIDYYTATEARMQQRAGLAQGAEWNEVFQKMRQTTRKIDQRNLTLQRDLSFVRALDQ